MKRKYFEKDENRKEELLKFTKKAYEIQKIRKKEEEIIDDTPYLSKMRINEFEYLKNNFIKICKKYKVFLKFSNVVERWCLTQKLIESEGDPL
jgi:hypothetical protein